MQRIDDPASERPLKDILIVGYGEIGKPLYEIAKGVVPEVDWLDVEAKTTKPHYSVMHICYPQNDLDSFVRTSVRYVERFTPELVLIDSTVTPGTTMALQRKIGQDTLLCHSPVRGNVAEGMKKGLFQYTKYIGPTSPEAGLRAKEHYESLGLRAQVLSSPLETELGKLFETTYRGLMMAWFQEINRICDKFGAQFDQVVEFVGSTEREGKQPRPVFHPGVIGGHCIIQNAQKLRDAYPSRFVEALLESNRAREKELQGNSAVKRDKKSPRARG